jgi:hypothetical protein
MKQKHNNNSSNNSFQHSLAYMKKEAVTIRPMASMKTARVGYHATGTGLDIAAAFEPFISIRKEKRKNQEAEQQRKSIQFSAIKIKKIIAIDLLPLTWISAVCFERCFVHLTTPPDFSALLECLVS